MTRPGPQDSRGSGIYQGMAPLRVQRARADRGFERIYRRHVGDVYRYALAVMRNPVDAEDVTQTTFLNAYRAYTEKGNRPDKPQNWLITIAHNVCRQRFRQSARRPAEVSFDDDIADAIVDVDTPSGEDIRRALGQLAFNQRAALVMRELEGRSYAEIADILELSVSAVETLIFRARRALREQLEGSLTCGEAEFAISRQLDGRLSRHEKAQLRAHLRECAECAHFARRQRAQRSALKSLGLIPVPSSLASLFGGGGAAVGSGVALKAAAAVVAGAVIGGGGYEAVRHAPWREPQPAAAKPTRPPLSTSAAIAGAEAVAREPARHAVALANTTVARGFAVDVHLRRKTHPHARNVGRGVKAKGVPSSGRERAQKQRALARGHARSARAVGAGKGRDHVKVHPVRAHQPVHPAHAQWRGVAPNASKPIKPPSRADAAPKPKPEKTVPKVPGPPDDKKAK
jgi:RNA polymerase sigma-70 factor, ECF subfamily